MSKRQQKKIAKKATEEKIETKDFAGSGTLNQIGVPSNVTDSTSATDVDTPQTSISYWPAPNLWYAQGKDAAKKSYFEYINAMNQYFSTPDDQPDLKLENAGKMNSLVTSMIQGVAIGVESLENAMRRVRIGDQSAVMEKDVTVATLTKLLKTIHVHNSAAYSGKLAGLEVKLIEPSLMSRLNRVEPMGVTSMGIPLASADEADTLWVEDIPTVPPTQEEVPQDQLTDEIPLDDIQTDEELPPEEGAGGEVTGEGDIPLEDIQTGEEGELPPEETQGEESVVPEGEEEVPQEDMMAPEGEETVQDEFPAEEEEGAIPIAPEEEIPVDETGQMEEEVPVEGEGVVDETGTEEVPVDETGQMQEEVPVDQGAAVDSEALKQQLIELVDADPEKAAQLLAEAQTDEVALDGETAPVDETGDVPTEGTDVPTEGTDLPTEGTPEEEPVLVYCYGCDQDVTQSDIDACEQPDCPFKQQEVVDEEVPVEETPIEEPQKKHFIMVDCDDHCDCEVHQIAIKGFTGIEGEYCLTHQKLIHYAFDQNDFTSEQAKAWVQKQFHANKIKNKTAEEIIIEKVDSLTDVELKAWLTPKVEKGSDEIDIDPQALTDTMTRVFKQAFQKQVVEPFEHRLKDLEA